MLFQFLELDDANKKHLNMAILRLQVVFRNEKKMNTYEKNFDDL